MTAAIRVPCAYQGGKQRVAKEIVDILLNGSGPETKFYDLCCGSGAISIELVNRGIDPSRIVMLDRSSWGSFWFAVGSGTFDMNVFDAFLSEVPEDKRKVKAHMIELAERPVGMHEAEMYPVLQSCAFGGKQIWYEGGRWVNPFFRDYWEPTEMSVRRSPANPMQPSPCELRRRVAVIVNRMQGVTCVKADIESILVGGSLPCDAVVYVDPPYEGTTGYAYGFDVRGFATRFRQSNDVPLYVSEGIPLAEDSVRLIFGGAKGGITGKRSGRHQEWLSSL